MIIWNCWFARRISFRAWGSFVDDLLANDSIRIVLVQFEFYSHWIDKRASFILFIFISEAIEILPNTDIVIVTLRLRTLLVDVVSQLLCDIITLLRILHLVSTSNLSFAI